MSSAKTIHCWSLVSILVESHYYSVVALGGAALNGVLLYYNIWSHWAYTWFIIYARQLISLIRSTRQRIIHVYVCMLYRIIFICFLFPHNIAYKIWLQYLKIWHHTSIIQVWWQMSYIKCLINRLLKYTRIRVCCWFKFKSVSV